MDRTETAAMAFDWAPVGLVLSENRVVVRCNAYLCRTFGYDQRDLEGKSLAQLYPSYDEFDRIGQVGLERMRRENFYVDERIMKRRNGEHFWCRVRGQSLTPEDPFARAIWSFADISTSRPLVNLTRRERQIATFLVDGLTSKEIARLLAISHRTVEAHRARLQAKFEARNGAELVARLTGLPD